MNLKVKPLFAKQEYEKLKLDCLKAKCLFEDDEFKANDWSIYRKRSPNKKIYWKRPKELFKIPLLYKQNEQMAIEQFNKGVFGNE